MKRIRKSIAGMLLWFMLITMAVSPQPFVLAEATQSESKAFVIDGILDPWYRNDVWAQNNRCYFYYRSAEDTTLMTEQLGSFYEPDLTPPVQEDMAVDIYSAFDDHYAYFYVEVTRDEISDSEAIEFYVDTDVMSCDGQFKENVASFDHADTHFTMTAKDLAVTDVEEGITKYSLADQKETTILEYFNNPENVKGFHKTDGAGNVTGYGCEARFPLVHNIEGHESYNEYAYNIAIFDVCESVSWLCLTTGYRWRNSYDTLNVVPYSQWSQTTNPFFAPIDEDQAAADRVAQMIEQLTAPEEIELWEAYTVEAARSAYDSLTDAQKTLMPQAGVDKLLACEQVIEQLKNPVINYGDVDGDKMVDAVDALMALKFAVNKITLSQEQQILADVNRSDSIDATDALIILKYAVGKIKDFPLH